MKRETQIFTSPQAQGVPVPQDILKGLEQGSMEAITERWRRFAEQKERSELDKIKEVFANGGAQAIELADMVGLGDDPIVYEMKEMVGVVIDMLDTITDYSHPSYGVQEGGKKDMSHRVWLPLLKKSLKKIYGYEKAGHTLLKDFGKLSQVYWGWHDDEEAISVIEDLATWAGHPVEWPAERRA